MNYDFFLVWKVYFLFRVATVYLISIHFRPRQTIEKLKISRESCVFVRLGVWNCRFVTKGRLFCPQFLFLLFSKLYEIKSNLFNSLSAINSIQFETEELKIKHILLYRFLFLLGRMKKKEGSKIILMTSSRLLRSCMFRGYKKGYQLLCCISLVLREESFRQNLPW